MRYRRALGAVLQECRTARGLTRPDVARAVKDLIETPFTARTLEAVETGRREISSWRLTVLSWVLEVDHEDIIKRVIRDLDIRPYGSISLDARSLAGSDALQPLRAWVSATAALRASHEVVLPAAAIAPLAQLCGLSVRDLLALLRPLSVHPRLVGQENRHVV
ncbi:helix-turn-helix domain-containing protein [Saccharothrix australiensis]|nr:helix-turn-helix domain-containing protein [Saccharothrix australiensis]